MSYCINVKSMYLMSKALLPGVSEWENWLFVGYVRTLPDRWSKGDPGPLSTCPAWPAQSRACQIDLLMALPRPLSLVWPRLLLLFWLWTMFLGFSDECSYLPTRPWQRMWSNMEFEWIASCPELWRHHLGGKLQGRDFHLFTYLALIELESESRASQIRIRPSRTWLRAKRWVVWAKLRRLLISSPF